VGDDGSGSGWPARSVDGGLDRLPLPLEGAALWLCGKRVVGPDPDAALRRADGADAIVCFNERSDLVREYPDYLDWLAANNGRRALWFPIPDLHAPALPEAETMVAAMVARLEKAEGLVLHCAGGLGRAPTMAVCVLIALGTPRVDALEQVRAHRPMGGPEAGAQDRLVTAFARVRR
jgi:hypothetical protein